MGALEEQGEGGGRGLGEFHFGDWGGWIATVMISISSLGRVKIVCHEGIQQDKKTDYGPLSYMYVLLIHARYRGGSL